MEGDLKNITDHNKSLESTNAQFKALIQNASLTKKGKSKSKRVTRKSSSTDRQRADLFHDINQSDFKTLNPKVKKPKLFHPFNNHSKDLLVTHPAPDLHDSVGTVHKEKKDRRRWIEEEKNHNFWNRK